MQAIHKGKTIEVWEVSKTGTLPDWVQTNFTKKAFQWDGNKVKCMMNVFKPSVGSTFIGENTYGILYASVGDFIDGSISDILSAKRFAKKYEFVES